MSSVPTPLRSRFGHRLLGLFVLCALVPTIAISVVTLRNVTRELTQQSMRRGQENSKSFALGILERLQVVEGVAKGLEPAKWTDPYHGSVRTTHLPAGVLGVEWRPTPALDPAAAQHLAAGKSLLTTTHRPGATSRIFLSRSVNSRKRSEGLKVTEVDPRFLWGVPTRTGLPAGTEITILDDSGALLYSSTPGSSDSIATAVQRPLTTGSGMFEWSSAGDTYVASSWSVLLKPSFGKSKWTVVLSESKADVLAPIPGFRQSFVPVLIFSFLVVVALSIRQIRRSIEPLHELQKGARRVAAQDFDSRVVVRSGDELEQVAADFNTMAERLGRQFAELGKVNEGLREQIQERERAERALRESEQQLRQAQKMDAVGTLAGGVAHDFNNLLTVIGSYTELALGTLDKTSPIREDLEQVAEAASRAGALTRQLLAFSRKQVLQPEVLDLNELVSGIEKMLRRLIGEHIEIATVQDPQGAWVHADRGQIDQVLMNLAVNARDAMPAGGRLLIEVSTAVLESEAAARLNVDIGAWRVITVRDTGTGMDETTRGRIFEPFFTTKAPGKGTGLGLSTVYGIVQQSGGAIELESEPGIGTAFRIYLPAVKAGRLAAAARKAGELEGGSGETVLLVEDEDPVRVLAHRVLQEAGYRMLVARDGAEGLILARGHEGPIHLLLTDVVMPNMGGKRLAEELRPWHPEMRVLYISGYTEDEILGDSFSGRATELLQKPFVPRELTEKVREVLDSDRAATRRPTRRLTAGVGKNDSSPPHSTQAQRHGS